MSNPHWTCELAPYAKVGRTVVTKDVIAACLSLLEERLQLLIRSFTHLPVLHGRQQTGERFQKKN